MRAASHCGRRYCRRPPLSESAGGSLLYHSPAYHSRPSPRESLSPFEKSARLFIDSLQSVATLHQTRIIEDHHAVAVVQGVLKLLLVVGLACGREDSHARYDPIADEAPASHPIGLENQDPRLQSERRVCRGDRRLPRVIAGLKVPEEALL